MIHYMALYRLEVCIKSRISVPVLVSEASMNFRKAQLISENSDVHVLDPPTPPRPFLKLWPSNAPQKRRHPLERELPVELADRVWGFVYGEASALLCFCTGI